MCCCRLTQKRVSNGHASKRLRIAAITEMMSRTNVLRRPTDAYRANEVMCLNRRTGAGLTTVDPEHIIDFYHTYSELCDAKEE